MMPPPLAAFGREHGGSLLQPHQVLIGYDDALVLGVNHLQLVRLRFLDEQRCRATSESALRLVCVVDRSPSACSVALTSGRVQVHPWVLEHLQVFDGCAIAIECVEEQSAPTPESAVVLVSVQDKYPTSLGVNVAPPPSVAAATAQPTGQNAVMKTAEGAIVSHVGLLPESVRMGKLNLERAILRQLRGMFGHELSARALLPRQLLTVRILQELYVLRVESVHLQQQEDGDAVASPIAIEVAGLGAYSVRANAPSSTPALGTQDLLENVALSASVSFEEQLESRLVAQGFVGYHEVMRDVLLHLALVLNISEPSSNEVIPGVDFQNMGSHGVILSGVHGIGKSLGLKVIEKELVREGITTWRIDAMSLLMDFENSKKATAHEYLSDKINQLVSNCNSGTVEFPVSPIRVVVLVDDLDVLFQSTDGQAMDEDTQAQHLPPLGSSLLRLLDDITARRSRVAVLGASSNAETDIPASARRVGRFGKTIELIVPTEAMRRDILQVHLQQLRLDDTRHEGSSSEAARDFAARMATLTGGYIAKDLVRICRNAAVAAFSRVSAGYEDAPEEFAVTWADLVAAQQVIKPSQLRELNVSAPGTAGKMDFVGYHDVRKQLFEFVSWKFYPTAAAQRLGVGNTSGILLYGPSGCGKSLLVKELTAQAKVNCVSVKSSELVSKFFGDSEKAIRQLFARARKAAPCLLFFDEFDAIAHKRSFGKGGDGDEDSRGGVYARILSTFLNELDGVGSAGKTTMDGILVVAATNRKDALDAALIRPGRIDKTLELGYPTQEDIQEILGHYTSRMPLAPDVDLAGLATTAQTSHRPVSGADISAVCKEAAFRALREDLDAREVCMRHFEAAWAYRLEESPV